MYRDSEIVMEVKTEASDLEDVSHSVQLQHRMWYSLALNCGRSCIFLRRAFSHTYGQSRLG